MASRFTPERIDFKALARPRLLDTATSTDADDTPTPTAFRAVRKEDAVIG